MYMSAGIDFNLIQVSLLNIAYEDFWCHQYWDQIWNLSISNADVWHICLLLKNICWTSHAWHSNQQLQLCHTSFGYSIGNVSKIMGLFLIRCSVTFKLVICPSKWGSRFRWGRSFKIRRLTFLWDLLPWIPKALGLPPTAVWHSQSEGMGGPCGHMRWYSALIRWLNQILCLCWILCRYLDQCCAGSWDHTDCCGAWAYTGSCSGAAGFLWDPPGHLIFQTVILTHQG